jgi:hypothetical protein
MSATISYKTLQELHQLYVNGKHQILSRDMDKPDTKNIWFELNDSMRTFLKEVLENKDINGIRMYFLQNPKTQEEMNGELIPTNKIDVDQLSIGLVATKPRALASMSTEDDPTTPGEDDPTVDPLNHGTLCPQLCG